MQDLLLLILSIAPGIAIVIIIYFTDIHEKEPWQLIVLSFIYGGIGLWLAIEISQLLRDFVSFHSGDLMGEAEHAFTVAFTEKY